MGPLEKPPISPGQEPQQLPVLLLQLLQEHFSCRSQCTSRVGLLSCMVAVMSQMKHEHSMVIELAIHWKDMIMHGRPPGRGAEAPVD